MSLLSRLLTKQAIFSEQQHACTVSSLAENETPKLLTEIFLEGNDFLYSSRWRYFPKGRGEVIPQRMDEQLMTMFRRERKISYVIITPSTKNHSFSSAHS